MSLTSNLESFFDNNTPGGYIQTNVSISNNDLDQRINQAISNKGFLTSASHLPWDHIDNKPIITNQVNADWNASSGIAQILNKPVIPAATTVTQTITNGIEIGKINGTSLYAPTTSEAVINVQQVQSSGTKIAIINGTDIFVPTDSSFATSVAHGITQNDINNWNDKSYSSLEGAPLLPEDTYNNSPAYETIGGQRIIKPFNTVAFTNDYNDLINKPTSLYSFLNLPLYLGSDYDNLTDNQNKLYELGTEDCYILDFDTFQYTNNGNTITLPDTINDFANAYYTNMRQFVIVSAPKKLYIINVTRVLLNDYINTPSYIQCDFITSNITNYTASASVVTSSEASTKLNNLAISPQTGTIIFDYVGNVIYCKFN